MIETRPELNAVEVFLKSWRVYQEIIQHNYMFHRELSDSCRDALERVRPGHKLRILDLGCGDASMALPLLAAERVACYVGCDLSQPALNIARTELDKKHICHRLVCDDLTRVLAEQADASFDVVLSSFALHHLNANQKQQTVIDIQRVLQPGGAFLLIDVFRESNEDRAAYMRNYMGFLKQHWTELSPEAQELVVDHATQYDFPEHADFYQNACRKQGLGHADLLSKHTWHQAWIFHPEQCN